MVRRMPNECIRRAPRTEAVFIVACQEKPANPIQLKQISLNTKGSAFSRCCPTVLRHCSERIVTAYLGYQVFHLTRSSDTRAACDTLSSRIKTTNIRVPHDVVVK